MEDVETWAAALAEALGIEVPLDRDLLLGDAKVAADAVIRPAAPLTTYLVGVAVGQALAEGRDPAQAAQEASRVVRSLAAGWPG